MKAYDCGEGMLIGKVDDYIVSTIWKQKARRKQGKDVKLPCLPLLTHLS